MPRPLAANHVPPRIGDVRFDGILGIRTSHDYDETQVQTEQGAPLSAHRQRVREGPTVLVIASDMEPVQGALISGLWELNHARKVRGRVLELARLGTAVQLFDGRKILRTIENGDLWRINSVQEEETPDETKVWRATLILAEATAFRTSFTSIDEEIAESEQASADGVVDKGQQSTETVPAATAAGIPT